MKYILFLIFVIALIVRFAYFPQNVYFAYDQARDSFFALDILKGDIRIIGPPSAASPILFPGPLSLYLYSFIYLVFGPNPEILSAFFRVYNAFGVFLVFLIGSKLFDKRIGVLGSLLYAVSYEQSQYALFMSHQPLAVLPVLLFYLGLTLFLFEKKAKGIILTSLGLGLAIQFHFVYIFLIPVMLLILLIIRKEIHNLRVKDIFISLGVFLLTTSTYIISEFKFGFRMISYFFSSSKVTTVRLKEALFALERFMHDSLLANYSYTLFLIAILVIITVFFIVKTQYKRQILFLIFWFLGGVMPYLLSGTANYYYSAAATVSLFLFLAFLVSRKEHNLPLIGTILYFGVIVNNLTLIMKQNISGPNRDIVIQPGMLISQEKAALDYIYLSADGKPFAVRSLSVPLDIATTWSYLFEWYGKQKYGYLPIWSEKPAEGFPGNLPYFSERSRLPDTQFAIIEPTVGIPERYILEFINEENIFTEVEEEKSFGTITVQKRSRI
ncbi:hypothetical protein A3A75_05025 [Candidatus Woesebacteria bacterium RIFCSPLOWO2_01_FULL_39_10]|uniref:Glycosyltransferase RgtA/B/C/D-like domain-containing protein n=1 Tax=Candidatus Woesebacteria bacterium RIFCSPLOWO2_01_FULL_39_10 TaxID=1802516 RepID=A0A1F8B2Y1_9BACT|nr:MAG: hypothetical protein A3A75_05025 [Candidatus Woesebacteria bacterium RIFCSPLOWO2_01_FULL_39_10]